MIIEIFLEKNKKTSLVSKVITVQFSNLQKTVNTKLKVLNTFTLIYCLQDVDT